MIIIQSWNRKEKKKKSTDDKTSCNGAMGTGTFIPSLGALPNTGLRSVDWLSKFFEDYGIRPPTPVAAGETKGKYWTRDDGFQHQVASVSAEHRIALVARSEGQEPLPKSERVCERESNRAETLERSHTALATFVITTTTATTSTKTTHSHTPAFHARTHT